MKSRIIGFLTALLISSTVVWAANTTKLNLRKTNEADMNSNLTRLDSLVGALEDCQQVLTVSGNPTEAGATDDYCSLGDTACSTTEANEDDFLTPTGLNMVASTLACQTATAPGAGDDWTLTLRDDGAATALTCVIDDTNTTCTDTSNAPVIVGGSKINMEIDSSAGASDPTVSALMECQLCLRPSW